MILKIIYNNTRLESIKTNIIFNLCIECLLLKDT